MADDGVVLRYGYPLPASNRILDGILSKRMKILDKLGIRTALCDALTDLSKSVAQEFGKHHASVVYHIAGPAARRAASEMAQAIGGEVLKETVAVAVGPILKILLHVVDDTKVKLNTILTEPEITATREAKLFLQLEPKTSEEKIVVNEKFAALSNMFDTAYTYAASQSGTPTRKVWIRMFQGLIARRRGADLVSQVYFHECADILSEDYAKEFSLIPILMRRLGECNEYLRQ